VNTPESLLASLIQKYPSSDLVYRLLKRAEIRQSITSRKSIQENKPDRISEILQESAQELHKLRELLRDDKYKIRYVYDDTQWFEP